MKKSAKKKETKTVTIERWETIPFLKALNTLMSIESEHWLSLVKDTQSFREVYKSTLEMVSPVEKDEKLTAEQKQKRIEEINLDKVDVEVYQVPISAFSQSKLKGSELMPLFDIILI